MTTTPSPIPVETDFRQKLRKFLEHDQFDYHQQWCKVAVARCDRLRDPTAEDQVQLCMRLLREVVDAAQSDQRPASGVSISNEGNKPSPREDKRSFKKGLALTSAKALGLDQVYTWADNADSSCSDLFEGVHSLCSFIEGVKVWRRKAAMSWVPADSIDAAMIASELLYDGVYRDWRSSWFVDGPVTEEELRIAVEQLRERIESLLELTPGRLRLQRVGSYNPDSQELESSGPPPATVMPVTFSLSAGPPDQQQRKAKVRAWNADAVSY